MTREIGFYKTEDDRWYAYLPEFIAIGGTEAECEMVRGADDYLDGLLLSYDGKANYVHLVISDTQKQEQVLNLVKKDEFGATYKVTDPNLKGTYKLWLCPVTLSVFNKYPDKIYTKVLYRKRNFKPNYEKVSTLTKLGHLIKIAPRIVKKLFS